MNIKKIKEIRKQLFGKLEKMIKPYENKIEYGNIRGPYDTTYDDYDMIKTCFLFEDLHSSTIEPGINYNSLKSIYEISIPEKDGGISKKITEKDLSISVDHIESFIKLISDFRKERYVFGLNVVHERYETFEEAWEFIKSRLRKTTHEELIFAKNELIKLY